MALSFPSGFQMAHGEPVDNRLCLTKEEMVAMKKAKMPQVYLTICKDDGKLYVYNSENDIDEELGRFRLLSASGLDADTVKDLIADDENNVLRLNESGNLLVEATESVSQNQILTLFQKEETSNGD